MRIDDLTLLYVGVSPRRSDLDSKQNLRKRIRSHFAGNASGSTLRLTLGVLLQDELGLELGKTGSTGRLTFGAGEDILSDWMGRNAFVCFSAIESPREIEERLISTLCLPLNLEGNEAHPFYASLRLLRSNARQRAREQS